MTDSNIVEDIQGHDQNSRVVQGHRYGTAQEVDEEELVPELLEHKGDTE